MAFRLKRGKKPQAKSKTLYEKVVKRKKKSPGTIIEETLKGIPRDKLDKLSKKKRGR